MTNMFPLDAERVKEIVRLNRKGVVVSNINPLKEAKNPEFMSAVGEDSISRFDDTGNGNKKSAPRKNNKGYRGKKRIKK
jgi:hypothetical protein